MSGQALLQSSIEGIPVRRGKVRDIYDFGEQLLIVATDRISAFDWVLSNGIPDKGRVLTKLSEMWFRSFDHLEHHYISTNLDDLPLPAGTDREALDGRSMVVRRSEVVPIECVVRGYLAGSGWKEYKRDETVCGIHLPSGLRESDQLAEPIFTPATKADEGHDINISFQDMCNRVGTQLSETLRDLSIDVYSRGAAYAREKGMIIADTKFEFGMSDGKLLLIDEVLTPDSSRFWPADQYEPGRGQASFDKQFVRDWLETTDWDKNSEPPQLPEDIVTRTREKYIDAWTRLTNEQAELLIA